MVNIASFDLNLLRVLDALLRVRSTVKAGQLLGLSQPAVSSALRRLRHALGDPLFVRKSQGLTPTRLALDLEIPLRDTLHRLEALLSTAEPFDPSTARFDFRIAASDFFATMLVPELGARLQRIAPSVRLQMLGLNPDSFEETIERHDVDLGIIPSLPLPAWLKHEALFDAGFAVIARTRHPRLVAAGVAPGAVIPLDLFCTLGHVLCSPEGKVAGLGDAALARIGRRRHVAVTVPVFEGVVQTVAATDLIGLLPAGLAARRAASEGLDLYRLPMPISVPTLCMIWHRRLSRDPAHLWMRDQVRHIATGLGTPRPGNPAETTAARTA